MSNLTPGAYIEAIDRELSEIKANMAFAKRHQGIDLIPHYEGEIMGLEIAKSIIKKTYYAFQESLHETRTKAEAGIRGRDTVPLDYCGAVRA